MYVLIRAKLHLDHLLPGDLSVLVDIKELEAPEYLLLVRALGDDGEKVHEVPEGDATRPLPVDGPEHDHGVLGGVAQGEYFLVDLLEGVLVYDAVGALRLEGPVQELHLALRELGLVANLFHATRFISKQFIQFKPNPILMLSIVFLVNQFIY